MNTKKYEILQIAGELFKNRGYKQVTMDLISSEMGISKKTLYKYFSNKKELIHSIISRYIDTEKSQFHKFSENTDNAVEEMVKLIKHVIQMFNDVDIRIYEDLKKYYPKSWKEMDSFLQVHIYNRIHQNILRGVIEGLYRENINADILAKMYVVKVLGIMEEQTFPGQIYDKMLLMTNMVDYHLRGILNVKGLEIYETYKISEN